MISPKSEDPNDGWSRTTILLLKDSSNKMIEDY